MTITAKPLVYSKYAENAQTTQYTAPAGTRAIITKATVTNGTASTVTFGANLVPAGNSAGAPNLVLDDRAIAAGESYTCPELVGHILEPGGFISTIASAPSALVLRVSGHEIT